MRDSALYGRKWKVTLFNSDSTQAWEISDENFSGNGLRCTFAVEKVAYAFPWYADLTIWNLSGDTMDNIYNELKQGMRVTIQAGYQNGTYGKIFDGQVFQPMFDRQNVTDFIMTLNCINGLGLLTGNLCNTTLESGYDYAGIIAAMARSARTSIPMSQITPNLDSKKLPRGKVIFGDPKKFLRQITQDNGAVYWYGDDGLTVSNPDDDYAKEALVVTPENGLVNTPQQVENGVIFQTLLNSDFTVKQPFVAVKLDNTVIRQAKVRMGQLVSPLDQDGTYKIIKVCHVGDTRGNEWYTEITGVNRVGNVSALLAM